MKFYSQKDPKWSKEKLGTCTDTIGQSGCKISCYGMFAEKNPSEVNKILKEKKGYTSGCLTSDAIDLPLLGLKFEGRVYPPIIPNKICIAETDHYKKVGVKQHFFIFSPSDNKRVDPLDLKPDWEENNYRIVSYRIVGVPVEIPVKNKIEEWALAIKKHEGWFPGSASYRNNNPGNFRCSPLVMGELGAIKCVNNLAVFPDYETGFKALKQFLIYVCTDQLKSYKSTMTLLEFYQRYAPSSDNNNPKNYAQCVAEDLKITPETIIGTLYSPELVKDAQVEPEPQPEPKSESTDDLSGYISSNGKVVEDVDNLRIEWISGLIKIIKTLWTKLLNRS